MSIELLPCPFCGGEAGMNNKTLSRMIDIFPTLDMNWPEEIRNKWMECYLLLWDTVLRR